VRHSEPGFVINQRWFTVQRGRGDGGLASLFEVREPPLGCDARWARPVRAPCLRGPKPSSRVVLVLLCWSPTMKRRDRRDLSHGIYQCLQWTRRPAFVRCVLWAVSGGARSKVLVGSVLVGRAGALPSFAFSAAPARGRLWAFSVDFGRAQHNLRGRVVFWGGNGGLGRVVQKK